MKLTTGLTNYRVCQIQKEGSIEFLVWQHMYAAPQ
jgi:hypothetical protein